MIGDFYKWMHLQNGNKEMSQGQGKMREFLKQVLHSSDAITINRLVLPLTIPPIFYFYFFIIMCNHI